MAGRSPRCTTAQLAFALLLGLSLGGQTPTASAAGKGDKTSVGCPVSGGAQVVLDPGQSG